MSPETEARREAGQRLKTAIHIALLEAGFRDLLAFSMRADTPSYDTFMNWYSGGTTPRPNQMKMAADALVSAGAKTSYAELWAAYEGRAPMEPPLVEAIKENTRVMTELLTRLGPRLEALASLATQAGVADAEREAASSPGTEGSRPVPPRARSR